MATATRTRTIELRLIDDIKDIPLIYRPVAYSGSVKGCKRYAAANGYCWLSKPSMLFRGYFVHPETGDCLMPS